MGIDPVTHKPFSHLMAEITSLAPPQVAHLADATLGCFKDEMLHLLTKKRIDFQLQQSNPAPGSTSSPYITTKQEEKEDAAGKIKLSLSRAIQEPEFMPLNKPWTTTGASPANFAGTCNFFSSSTTELQYAQSSPWSHSMGNGSPCTEGGQAQLHEKHNNRNGEDFDHGKEIRNSNSIFSTECILWDIPSDDLINPIV